MVVLVFYSRYEANADGYKFSFNRCNIYCLNFDLFTNAVFFLDMYNGSYNVGFLDTTINNDSSIVESFVIGKRLH